MRKILHGIAKHDYLAIIQPAFSAYGLDCSSIRMGIGCPHQLECPRTGEIVQATLIQKRTLYTDSDLCQAIMYLIYGAPFNEVMARLREKNEDMIEEIVEIWIFKKD